MVKGRTTLKRLTLSTTTRIHFSVNTGFSGIGLQGIPVKIEKKRLAFYDPNINTTPALKTFSLTVSRNVQKTLQTHHM